VFRRPGVLVRRPDGDEVIGGRRLLDRGEDRVGATSGTARNTGCVDVSTGVRSAIRSFRARHDRTCVAIWTASHPAAMFTHFNSHVPVPAGRWMTIPADRSPRAVACFLAGADVVQLRVGVDRELHGDLAGAEVDGAGLDVGDVPLALELDDPVGGAADPQVVEDGERLGVQDLQRLRGGDVGVEVALVLARDGADLLAAVDAVGEGVDGGADGGGVPAFAASIACSATRSRVFLSSRCAAADRSRSGRSTRPRITIRCCHFCRLYLSSSAST
jgi:hypothetical protein